MLGLWIEPNLILTVSILAVGYCFTYTESESGVYILSMSLWIYFIDLSHCCSCICEIFQTWACGHVALEMSLSLCVLLVLTCSSFMSSEQLPSVGWLHQQGREATITAQVNKQTNTYCVSLFFQIHTRMHTHTPFTQPPHKKTNPSSNVLRYLFRRLSHTPQPGLVSVFLDHWAWHRLTVVHSHSWRSCEWKNKLTFHQLRLMIKS